MGLPRTPQVNGMDPRLWSFLDEMRTIVERLNAGQRVPGDPTNLSVTPIALGNVIQFTRAGDASRYTLYISTTPSRTTNSPIPAVSIDLGDSNRYTDIVGQAGVTRYYWVRAWRGDIGSPNIIGYQSGVTLAAGVSTTAPAPPPPGPNVIIDSSTGLPVHARKTPKGFGRP